MQKSIIAFLVGFMLLCGLALAPVSAQELDAVQKEVWSAVENAWDMFAKKDLDGMKQLFENPNFTAKKIVKYITDNYVMV